MRTCARGSSPRCSSTGAGECHELPAVTERGARGAAERRIRSVVAGALGQLRRPTAGGLPDGSTIVPVLAGPLRGCTLVMPALERPSYLLGTYERRVVEAIRAAVPAGGVAYDVGAHIGYHTLVMARAAGAGGTIIAFEPDARNRRCLIQNLQANGAGHVVVDGRALSGAGGEQIFASYGYSSVGHLFHGQTQPDARLARVTTTTLDALVFEERLPRPALVKLDVEGAEADVIGGAERVLAEVRPTLIVEARPGLTVAPIVAILKRHRYRWRPADPAARRWESAPRADLVCSPATSSY